MMWITDQAHVRKRCPDSLLTGKVSKFWRATASKIGFLWHLSPDTVYSGGDGERRKPEEVDKGKGKSGIGDKKNAAGMPLR